MSSQPPPLSLHEVLDVQSEAMNRVVERSIARADWSRLTDLARIGGYWDEIGFDLWLERINEVARDLKR